MRYIVASVAEAERIAADMFRVYRAEQIAARGLAADAPTLDRNLRGKPVLPPVTTSYLPVVREAGQVDALVMVDDRALAWDGQEVSGRKISLAAAVELDKLPQRWRDHVQTKPITTPPPRRDRDAAEGRQR